MVSFQLTPRQLKAETMAHHGLKARGSEDYNKKRPGNPGRFLLFLKLPFRGPGGLPPGFIQIDQAIG